MRIRILTSIASADWSYACSQEVSTGEAFTPSEVPAAVAAIWIESGIAEVIGQTETASLQPVIETAVLKPSATKATK